jgi:hypothetical protein
VWEELDAPAEFFYNEATKTLFLWHNDTAGTPPPTDGSLSVTQTKWLFNVTGSQVGRTNTFDISTLDFPVHA